MNLSTGSEVRRTFGWKRSCLCVCIQEDILAEERLISVWLTKDARNAGNSLSPKSEPVKEGSNEANHSEIGRDHREAMESMFKAVSTSSKARHQICAAVFRMHNYRKNSNLALTWVTVCHAMHTTR